MNALISTASSVATLLVAQASASPALKWHVDRIANPKGQVEGNFPVPLAVRQEAAEMLANVGKVEMVSQVSFGLWMKPFFLTAGKRAVSPLDEAKHIYALWDLVSDMPAEVFTMENRRKVAGVSEFVPTAARIREVMGADAVKVLAWHRALEVLAVIPAPAPAAPPPPTEGQCSAEACADIDKTLAAFKADMARSEASKTVEAHRAGPRYLDGLALAMARRQANIPLSPTLQETLDRHEARR